MMFTNLGEIKKARTRLRSFITEAIQVEASGRKLPEAQGLAQYPDELVESFAEVRGLREAFESLTPGRQRAYLLHFSGAKQAATRRSRIQKCAPKILEGRGLND